MALARSKPRHDPDMLRLQSLYRNPLYVHEETPDATVQYRNRVTRGTVTYDQERGVFAYSRGEGVFHSLCNSVAARIPNRVAPRMVSSGRLMKHRNPLQLMEEVYVFEAGPEEKQRVRDALQDADISQSNFTREEFFDSGKYKIQLTGRGIADDEIKVSVTGDTADFPAADLFQTLSLKQKHISDPNISAGLMAKEQDLVYDTPTYRGPITPETLPELVTALTDGCITTVYTTEHHAYYDEFLADETAATYLDALLNEDTALEPDESGDFCRLEEPALFGTTETTHSIPHPDNVMVTRATFEHAGMETDTTFSYTLRIDLESDNPAHDQTSLHLTHTHPETDDALYQDLLNRAIKPI